MVISVTAYAPKELRADLAKAMRVRETSLDIAYSIPGYKEAPLEAKNAVYDAIREAVARVA